VIVTNPWLGIPLSDYESHMALPDVAQAPLLADIFEALLRARQPRSVAVIGCAGGNGFDRIDAAVTTRVVGVDINPAYLDVCRERHGSRFAQFELIAADIANGDVHFAPVDFIYAGLVLEYVDVNRAMKAMSSLLVEKGTLATVIQLPGSLAVTPSPFTSVERLAPAMHFVEPGHLLSAAASASLHETPEGRRVRTRAGKAFEVHVFRYRDKLLGLRRAADADVDGMLDVWLRSVRATHDFLREDEIEALLPQVRTYLIAATPTLFVLSAESGEVVAFMGMTENHIDSLFLAPECFGRGYGRWLVEFALEAHDELTVDVNEENAGAVRFYEKCGFAIESRSERDPAGRPHPLLHMRLAKTR
jgi:ribosomal protein S18 acetylase RimI-like enzyme